MLIDARQVEKNSQHPVDICIIGAGTAGITIALEFNRTNFQICLLESGEFLPNRATQSLSKGEVIGEPYSLQDSRSRQFGGTTNLWGGVCLPLDEIDFEERTWLPHSGWPFSREHLVPYYQRSQKVLGLADYQFYNLADWQASLPQSISSIHREKVISQTFQFNRKRRRFGEVYREEIVNSLNISLYTYANAIDIELSKNRETAKSVKVACLNGNYFHVSAQYIVLAAGGIENVRLLLASNDEQSIGNENGLIGRFFMEHSYRTPGYIIPNKSRIDNLSLYADSFVIEDAYDEARVSGMLSLKENILRSEKLMSIKARLFRSVETEQAPSVQSYKKIKDTLSKQRLPEDPLKALNEIVKDMPQLIQHFNWAIANRVSALRTRGDNHYVVVGVEHQPHSDNQVTLSPQRDCLGQRRAKLTFSPTESDEKSYQRCIEILRDSLEAEKIGKVVFQTDRNFTPYYINYPYGSHHMGTTRMHEDPNLGVVDRNCRMHSISNLFITGSSVFPTGGSANPTLTIVTLAIRLSDRLKRLLKDK